MSEPIFFEDTFSVLSVNSQKYERVARIAATSNDQQISLTLDVNTELYPMNVHDRVQIALALTLNLDGSKDDSKGWRNVGLGERTLADEYDYVSGQDLQGKIYRFKEGNGADI
jgi:DNA-directed RNA polymerases I, II, and III subunit RPABC3